jgi:hypothetical protein
LGYYIQDLGFWDEDMGIFAEWEKDMMKVRKLRYSPRAGNVKQCSGCFNKLLRAGKRDRLGGMNSCGRKSFHKRHLKISREGRV